MRRSAAILVTAAALTLTGAAPAIASPPSPAAASPRAVLDGDLGYLGGAFPGGFHPTAGTVRVVGTTTATQTSVGPSGEFRLRLPAGTYTVTGCGPSAGPTAMCSPPRTIRLWPGQVRHIRLVWALAP